MRKVIASVFNNISPVQLKRYGIYAILSFFISFCVIIAADDIRVRNADVSYERAQNESLRKMLDEQYKLKTQQENLLKDTLKHK